MGPRDGGEGPNQIRNVAPIEDRSDEQHSRSGDSRCGTGPGPDSRRNDEDSFLRDVEALHQFSLREFRNRDDGARTRSRLAGQPASPHPLADAEPFGVRSEREIVDGDDRRHTQAKRGRVPGREPHIEVIVRCDGRHPDLFPPRSRRAGDDAGREAARVEVQRDGFGCVKYELVAACAIVD